MESVKESEFMKSPLPIKIHININFEKSLFPENEFQTAFGKTVKKHLVLDRDVATCLRGASDFQST